MLNLKKSVLSVAVIAASVASVSAFAADQFVNVGVNGAYTAFSKADLDGSEYLPVPSPDFSVSQSNNKTKSMGYGATLGYEYALVPSFRIGAELGYENLGKTKFDMTDNYPSPYASAGTSNVSIKQHMFTLLATADYFVTPNWNIIGKVGPAWVSQDTSVGSWPGNTAIVPILAGSYKAHKVAPYINLGTSYHFDNMSVGVSYGHLFGSKIKSTTDLQNSKKVLSSNSLQLNLGYTFPI